MNRNQIIALSLCSILLIGLYFFGKTKKGKEDNAHVASEHNMQKQAEELDIQQYIDSVNSNISDKTTKERIVKLTESKSYEELLPEYQKLDKPLAIAYYFVKAAEVKNQVVSYIGAGDYNTMLMPSAPDEKAKKFLSSNAIECYKKAVALDSTNTDSRIRLAGAYMEDGAQPMQGVLLLLEVVKKDSNNVDAQLMLGRYGLISGQTDKAIARFEKILYLQPQNSEALYLLAQAYITEGNKQKALGLLEKCRKLVQDPEAKKEIEKQIKNIKQPS